MAPLITVDGLVRRFGDRAVIDGLDFSVAPGEIFGFLGHNGAGKTTTVRLLTGVLARHGGTVRVLDRDPATDGDAVRAAVGVLTESPALDERFTARDNLLYFARLHELPDAASRVDELLAFFELGARGGDLVASYSKGMKQKLAIARAMLHRPRVLFLDEPTSGLDPAASKLLADEMRRYVQDGAHAIFFTTHRLVEASSLCHRVAIVQHGRIVKAGTPHEVVAQIGGARPVSLDVDDPARGLAFLAARFGTARVHQEGPELHVDALARDDVPALVKALVDEGLRVYGVRQVAPTLEEAYLSIHGSTAAPAPPPRASSTMEAAP